MMGGSQDYATQRDPRAIIIIIIIIIGLFEKRDINLKRLSFTFEWY